MSSENKDSDGSNCCSGKGKCVYKDEYARKWLTNASIHGLEHIVDGKSNIRRIIWMLIVVISASGCLYTIVDHFILFFNRPTATTVNFETQDNGLPFPAVTVCNLNPVLLSYAEENNITEFLEVFLNPSFQQFVHDGESSTCKFVLEFLGLTNSTLTLNEVYNDGGNEVENFIISCQFNENHTISEDCKDELQPVLTEFGLCYTFNSIRNKKADRFIRSPGRRNSLQLSINISQYEYLPSNGEAGVLVSIHHRNDFAEPLVNGIAVAPGQSAWIGLSAQEINDNTGLGKCENNNKDLEFLPDLDYTISACQTNARYTYISRDDTCNCLENADPNESVAHSRERNCTLADICCIIESNFIDTTCPPPCNYFTYDTSTSYSQYPSVQLQDNLIAILDTSSDNIDNNILSVNVYFQDLYVMKFDTVLSYSTTALLADIGGLLGLFLGVSIISILEIIILLLDEIKRICCPKKVRKKIEEFELKHRLPSFKKVESGNEKEDSV